MLESGEEAETKEQRRNPGAVDLRETEAAVVVLEPAASDTEAEVAGLCRTPVQSHVPIATAAIVSPLSKLPLFQSFYLQTKFKALALCSLIG
nr:hypothetical protein Itr_chr04CG06420 [Ipomoea trifida]